MKPSPSSNISNTVTMAAELWAIFRNRSDKRFLKTITLACGDRTSHCGPHKMVDENMNEQKRNRFEKALY